MTARLTHGQRAHSVDDTRFVLDGIDPGTFCAIRKPSLLGEHQRRRHGFLASAHSAAGFAQRDKGAY
jgi:hypothetical protein